MAHSSAAPATLADRIALDIQRGLYSPGSWLKQIDLQTRYDATRIEVRKALDQLVLKRLLEHIPNRGYHVYVPDMERLQQIREIRVLLETGAAERAAQHMTARQIKKIRALAEQFQQSVDNGTLLEQYESNRAFHRAMYETCPNKELVALILDIRNGTPSAPTTQWRTHARIQQSAQEHFQMIEALEAQDIARLKEIIAHHIRY